MINYDTRRKQLLLKDLSARIPYQPLCKITDTEYDFCECDGPLGYSLRDFVGNNVIIKPYLRPISSMTKEEKEEARNLIYATVEFTDWCNEHHLDYRHLIEKELVLEASEEIYK